MLPVNSEGVLDLEALASALNERTRLVSIIAANNESGTIQPIEAIATLVRKSDAFLHFDATQALGRIPVDVVGWDADLMTVSSHKVGGPHGAGALWVRHGTPMVPLIHGGHQERNRRAGTEATAILAGFGAACRLAHSHMADEAVRLAALRDRLWAGIQAITPEATKISFCTKKHNFGDPFLH